MSGMGGEAKNRGRWTVVVIVVAVVVLLPLFYFGTYFLAADYVDVGDNAPLYVLRYRLGAVSLDRVAFLFEPARRMDEWCFRRRQAWRAGPRLELPELAPVERK